MLKILITGGAGFIGSNLVRYLVRRGHQVLNVDRLTYAGNLRSLVDIENEPNYRFAKVDIVDAESIRQALVAFAPDAVMHLAAESHVDRSIDGPRPFVETNVCGTMNLLQAALAHWRTLDAQRSERFRFLHVSTDEVFGSLGPEGLFTERSRYDPHSPYSASKAASDHLARAWKETYGLPVVVTHCSNNYGPYQFPEKLVPLVILKCLRGEPIPVFGDGENVRDWLYVDDHCEALAAVLAGGRPGETFNIGGNNPLRNIDLVRTLCGIMNGLRPSEDGPPRPRPAVRHRQRPDSRPARLATEARPRFGLSRNGALVPGEYPMVAVDPQRQLPPRAARATGRETTGCVQRRLNPFGPSRSITTIPAGN
jgi:dTDP-glucose 4,6-dehydratase